MSKMFVAAIVVIVTVFALLVALDVVVLSLKKRKAMPTGVIGRYFSKHLMQFNSFVILIVFCAVWLVPLLIGFIGSLTSQYAFENNPGELVPSDGFTFDNFVGLFKNYDTDDFKIFAHIVLPLAKSVFFVQGLFSFMGAWNDLLWPQIILGTADKSLWTLQVGIAYISSAKTANTIGLGLAGAVFSAFPILILYIFTQNKIIEGVATAGVKG